LIHRWVARRDGRIDDYVYLPIRARNGDGTIILHADIAYPVAVLAIDPWAEVSEVQP
jgi:hypothetical protein